MKTIVLIFCLFCITKITLAQSAKEYYLQSETAQQKGEYSEAIIYAEKAKELLINTNPKIESLLMMAYFNNGDIVNAKIAYETLLKITPYSKQQSDSFQKFLDTGKQIDEALDKEEGVFQKNKIEEQEQRMAVANEVLKKYAVFDENKISSAAENSEKIQSRLFEKAQLLDNDEDILEFTSLYPESDFTKYQKAINTGDLQFEQKEYNNALDSYENALNYKPADNYALAQKEATIEEIAWQVAQNISSTEAYYTYLDKYPNGNYASTATETIKYWDTDAYNKAVAGETQEALNAYLNNYPRGEYRSAIRNKLTERKEYDVYMYAKTNNYITNYETYINKYPNGKYASEVNSVIENSYYKFGNDAYASKNFSTAKGYYDMYISKFPYGKYSYEVRRKIKKCQRKLNQRSASFLMYTYDYESPIGISIGNLNKNKAGYYLNLKMNPEIFTGFDVLWTIDNQGDSDSPWDLDPTGEIKNANVSLSSGVTFKIAYPLWGYVGGGIGYFPQYDEVDEYDSNGDLYETVWMKNTDETSFGFFPEGGLMLKVSNALVLKYGIMHRQELIHQFGFGFQL
jgi:outer membrane protein assembly factor BamD (BamD/ComL family)